MEEIGKKEEMNPGTGITRREFIKGTVAGAGAAVVAASGVLSACATGASA